MKERVQLNLSVTREQKLALQALAEGHGTSVTKLVLGLIEVPEVAAVVVEAVPETIKSAGDVPAAIERATPGRVFSPDPKVAKPGKRTKAEPASTCRHGLMRCKVCGTLNPHP